VNTLISTQEGLSLAVINGRDYPIVDVNPEYATIAVISEVDADGIAMRVNGDKVETPQAEFPYEVRVGLSKFDKIIEVKNWEEFLKKHLTD
jgi:hypothetical protein